jgi:hypothetical protein
MTLVPRRGKSRKIPALHAAWCLAKIFTRRVEEENNFK